MKIDAFVKIDRGRVFILYFKSYFVSLLKHKDSSIKSIDKILSFIVFRYKTYFPAL